MVMLGRVVLAGLMRLVVRHVVLHFDPREGGLRQREGGYGGEGGKYQDGKNALHKILPHELPFYKYFSRPSPALNLIPKGRA